MSLSRALVFVYSLPQQRGTGEVEGANYDEITYEGYGPAGVAILVACLTDNRNRTVAELRNIFSKCGGNLGESGCVAWMFEQTGLIQIPGDKADEDAPKSKKKLIMIIGGVLTLWSPAAGGLLVLVPAVIGLVYCYNHEWTRLPLLKIWAAPMLLAWLAGILAGYALAKDIPGHDEPPDYGDVLTED